MTDSGFVREKSNQGSIYTNPPLKTFSRIFAIFNDLRAQLYKNHDIGLLQIFRHQKEVNFRKSSQTIMSRFVLQSEYGDSRTVNSCFTVQFGSCNTPLTLHTRPHQQLWVWGTPGIQSFGLVLPGGQISTLDSAIKSKAIHFSKLGIPLWQYY